MHYFLIGDFLLYLGLMFNFYAPCPSPYDILPCECDRRYRITLTCSNVESDARLKKIFKSTFPRHRFPYIISLSEYSQGAGITGLTGNIFGDISFEEATFQGLKLREVDLRVLKASESTLRFLILRDVNISDDSISFRSLGAFTTLQALDLGYNRFQTFPQLNSTTLTKLFLNRNKINSLTNLPSSFLPNLAELHLQDNGISTLKPGTFQSLGSLRTLQLSGNKITSLVENTFGFLSALERLDLRYNMLSTIAPGAFRHLQRLRYLYLQDNALKTIEVNTFQGLILHELNIGSNPLTSIGRGTFADMPHVHVLFHNVKIPTLDESWALPLFQTNYSKNDWGNIYACNCSMAWLVQFNFTAASSATCKDGTRVANLDSLYFEMQKCF